MSYRSYNLSDKHFAYSWPTSPEEAVKNDRGEVNQLAIDFANLPDGPQKEEVFLRLVKCFHGYLMKYTYMVVGGMMPAMGTPAGKESAAFLRTRIGKGTPINQHTLLATCRSLHLAFKQQTMDDVYDTMVYCFLRACRKYDPYYSAKVKEVYDAVNDCLKQSDPFVVADITEKVVFNAGNSVRWLASKGILKKVLDTKGRLVGYIRGTGWPADPKIFESGPVGFTYFVAQQFRYYLNDHVKRQMFGIESEEHILQLDNLTGSYEHGGVAVEDPGLPHAFGNFTDHNGYSWAADTQLINSQFDVSAMNNDWVRESTDRLFKALTPKERLVLKMVFVDGATWVDIAAIMDCSANTVKINFDQIMFYLRNHVQVKKAS
jgi:hypothetical protein